jgi:hypothetical protein
VIYFNKLVDIIKRVLQHRKISPFGEHHMVDYFKRIEFQHRGSPPCTSVDLAGKRSVGRNI